MDSPQHPPPAAWALDSRSARRWPFAPCLNMIEPSQLIHQQGTNLWPRLHRLVFVQDRMAGQCAREEAGRAFAKIQIDNILHQSACDVDAFGCGGDGLLANRALVRPFGRRRLAPCGGDHRTNGLWLGGGQRRNGGGRRRWRFADWRRGRSSRLFRCCGGSCGLLQWRLGCYCRFLHWRLGCYYRLFQWRLDRYNRLLQWRLCCCCRRLLQWRLGWQRFRFCQWRLWCGFYGCFSWCWFERCFRRCLDWRPWRWLGRWFRRWFDGWFCRQRF